MSYNLDRLELLDYEQGEHLWPAITYASVTNYFLHKPCHDGEATKAYKSADAYQYVKSGKVHNLRTAKPRPGLCILNGYVGPSQKSGPVYECWVLATEEGEIQDARCTCMAGLGRACSHAAAICFVVDFWMQVSTTDPDPGLAPTELPCEWIKPRLKKVDLVESKDFSYTRHKCDPAPTVPRKRKVEEIRALPDTAGFLKRVQEIKIGVMNMTSILLTPGKNLLYIPTIQKVVKYSILSFVAFLCLSMGGMMTGFILGYANHNDRASPLDRSRLSNVAGYFLVATSYGMLVGCTCMLFFSDAFMLLGSIGDLYLCRSTREYNSDVALKDLAVSLVMNATVNRHHVQKLLKYSRIEQHCVEHQGIAGLAGIRREDLRSAFENIVQIQYDLANHFTADVDYAVTQLLQRHALLQAFTQSITAKTPTLKLDDNKAEYKKLTETVAEDIKFGEKFSNDTVMFKSIAITACQDYSLEKCDEAKTDILSFLDQFESIGACKKIQGVFHESFRILCDGMLDYVNGFWFAMLLLVIVFDYAIYISLVGSKYLYTMTTYTYEGEPVPEGVVAATEDERMRQEQAEKYRIMRLRRMARDPDGVIKDISPSIQSPPTSEPEPEPQPLTSNISGSSQGAHSGSMEPMKPSQAKPVAVPPPASRVPNDDLATEFRF